MTCLRSILLSLGIDFRVGLMPQNSQECDSHSKDPLTIEYRMGSLCDTIKILIKNFSFFRVMPCNIHSVSHAQV